jgi:hypothetical protein
MENKPKRKRIWRFDGNRLIAPDGTEWSAVSGPYGQGSLPEGLYRIGKAVAIDPDNPGNRPYRDSAGLAWWCPIYPSFITDRTGLGVHPDGNIPGTAGCIGIKERDTAELLERLKEAEGETLDVNISK